MSWGADELFRVLGVLGEAILGVALGYTYSSSATGMIKVCVRGTCDSCVMTTIRVWFLLFVESERVGAKLHRGCV